MCNINIKGVKNDTTDIILNFKKVRFNMNNEEVNSELVSFDIEGDATNEQVGK